MPSLTIDALRTLATRQGLDLTDEELAGLLPLVQAGQAMMESLRALPLADVEPSSQYRMV
ncbi:MAG TPA: hypothetical protein VGT40_07835 [Methylomirabilota bacterium]|jgi:hypothetical protein|nr:hypothetical protein [Methylomirabilota bacterium]